MHALLAIAALHLSYTSGRIEERSRYTLSAVRHHSEALRTFVPYLRTIDLSNADTCFAAGCITSMMNTYSIAEVYRSGRLVKPSDIVQTFRLLRGTFIK